MDKLIRRIGLIFNNTSLIQGALAHRSYAHEHPDRAHGLADSERLEFLGDSIVNFIAADLLYRHFPNRPEGQLTKLRASLIKTGSLAGFAREIDLGSYILMGKGERNTGTHTRNPLLADTFEALVAAIYLDQGLDAARAFVTPFFESQIAQIQDDSNIDADDYKSQLLTVVQGRFGVTPSYRIAAESGPEHRREFTAEVYRGEQRIGSGSGLSKQLAEQEAAREALALLAEH
ncbi:ribonuclease III [Chloroflexia bacterium SDU3-3]|nr:ribonuclease III [Chloroflexia bacterium SDU3-3]